jgi:UDP-N-acetylglucosamine acyltransferase
MAMGDKERRVAKIHPTAVIEGDVQIGEGARVEAFVWLRGPLVIGRDAQIWPHCVLGGDAEHRTRPTAGAIRIGDGVILREHTVVTRGTGERDTEIQSGAYLMDHCHVSHDCLIEEGATLSHNVVLAGHTIVQRGATLGIGSVTHQLSTIGAFAMLGMASVITRDVPPFALVVGNPARFRRLNTHAIKAQGFGKIEIVDGALVTDDARALACGARFAAASRRPALGYRR